MKYLEEVIDSGLFKGINQSNYRDAYSQLKIYARNYIKNEIIFLEGDVIDGFCIIKAGSVRAEKAYPNGEVHIVDVYEEGSVFALEISASRKKTAAIDFISNEDSTIVYVSMHSIEQSSYSGEIETVLTHMLADDNIRMGNKVEILAERGLRDRIMVYLRILQTKSGTDTVNINMNREQMAAFLCVNRSALSNELSKMKREGIIDIKGKKIILKGNS